jgi:hypothetical protein
MIRFVTFVLCFLVGLQVGAQILPPGGMPTPPVPSPVTGCVSTLDDVSISPTSQVWTWVSVNFAIPRGVWKYTWNEVFNYHCSSGYFAMCKICSRVEVDIYSATNNPPGWIVLDVQNGPSVEGGCERSYTANFTTSWWSMLPPGTSLMATWEFAEFRPDLSNDCFGQIYQPKEFRTFVILEPGGD